MANRLRIADGVIIEDLGDEVLLTAPGSGQAIRVSAEGREVIDSVRSGVAVDSGRPIVAQLVDAGVLTSSAVISRRGLVRVGAVGAVAGVGVFAMPTAALASSSQSVALGPGYLAQWYYTLEDGGLTRKYVFDLSGDFSDRPNEAPSSLSALDTTTEPPVSWSATGSGAVEWRLLHSGSIDFPSTIDGTFTWGETLYSVTFNLFEE